MFLRATCTFIALLFMPLSYGCDVNVFNHQFSVSVADELEKFSEVTDCLNRQKVAVLEGKLGWV